MTAAPHGEGRDARRAQRTRVDVLVPVINAITQRAMGLTRDISVGGMQLQTDAPLVDEALYQVQIELQRPGGARVPVEAGVQVVRQDRGDGDDILVGMRFIHLDGTNSQRLHAWLAQASGPR